MAANANSYSVGAFNQEKALIGALSLIMKNDCETDGSSAALMMVWRRMYKHRTALFYTAAVFTLLLLGSLVTEHGGPSDQTSSGGGQASMTILPSEAQSGFIRENLLK